MELTAEERELMAKLGIPLDANGNPCIKTTRKCKHEVDKAPKTIDLSKHSGIIRTKCTSCGAKYERFVDYIKRTDTEGYYVQTVIAPTHEVTREHSYTTISCIQCASVGQLIEMSPEKLAGIIINLRTHILSNNGGDK